MCRDTVTCMRRALEDQSTKTRGQVLILNRGSVALDPPVAGGGDYARGMHSETSGSAESAGPPGN